MLKPGDKQTVDTYLMEMSKGQFLRINANENGDGTWFDTTTSVWDAYFAERKALKNIADLEFSDFPKGYPKFHKVRFTMERMKGGAK